MSRWRLQIPFLLFLLLLLLFPKTVVKPRNGKEGRNPAMKIVRSSRRCYFYWFFPSQSLFHARRFVCLKLFVLGNITAETAAASEIRSRTAVTSHRRTGSSNTKNFSTTLIALRLALSLSKSWPKRCGTWSKTLLSYLSERSGWRYKDFTVNCRRLTLKKYERNK